MKPRIPQKGYVMSFHLNEMPVHIHWTFPVGGLALMWFFRAYSVSAAATLIISYSLLILVHELGHAVGARIFSAPVHGILITAAGGWCFADEPENFFHKLVFYAGGLIAQFIALIFVSVCAYFVEPPKSPTFNLFVLVFTIVNLFVIIVNLIPSGENDGKKIFDLLRNR